MEKNNEKKDENINMEKKITNENNKKSKISEKKISKKNNEKKDENNNMEEMLNNYLNDDKNENYNIIDDKNEDNYKSNITLEKLKKMGVIKDITKKKIKEETKNETKEKPKKIFKKKNIIMNADSLMDDKNFSYENYMKKIEEKRNKEYNDFLEHMKERKNHLYDENDEIINDENDEIINDENDEIINDENDEIINNENDETINNKNDETINNNLPFNLSLIKKATIKNDEIIYNDNEDKNNETIINENIKNEDKNNETIINENIKNEDKNENVYFLSSLNQSRIKKNKLIIDKNLYKNYLLTYEKQGFYEYLGNVEKTKLFFDFDDINSEQELNIIINKIKNFFNLLNFSNNDLLIQKRVSGKKIKAHIITPFLYAERKSISQFQKLMNIKKILDNEKIDFHAVLHDQFRNSYWSKKLKYDFIAEPNSFIKAENDDELLNSFVSLINNKMVDVTNIIDKFNKENENLIDSLKQKKYETNEEYYVDDIKKTIANYLSLINNIKIEPNNIKFKTLSDGKKYLSRHDFYPNKKSNEEIYLRKDKKGEPLTKGAPILFNEQDNGFSLISMYVQDDMQIVFFKNKKTSKNSDFQKELNEWFEEKDLINYENAWLEFNKFNLIEGKPGCGKTNLCINHMAQQKDVTKLIIETRLTQRETHKEMILKIDPEAVIYEIDGNNRLNDEYYIEGIIENKNWFIVNDLSFYQRFKKYYNDAQYYTNEKIKIFLLIDEAVQIINNLALNENILFEDIDLKEELFEFIEKNVETCYSTDLSNIEALKELFTKKFKKTPEFNILKLKSNQIIDKLILNKDMMFFFEKIYKNYLDGKKCLAYFDTVNDLQTFYCWIIKIFEKNKNDFHNINDILMITGDHDNIEDMKILNGKKIILTTCKIFNCISIDCNEDDETFIFTSNQKMINNYSKLNSALRQRKSKILNICIDETGLFLTHNNYGIEKKHIKTNTPFYDYLNTYDSLTMIDAIKKIINRGPNFIIENLIENKKKQKIKKQKLIRLKGEKNQINEKILKTINPEAEKIIENFNIAKKNVNNEFYKDNEDVKKILDEIKIENLDKKIIYLSNNKPLNEIKKTELINKIKTQMIIDIKEKEVKKMIKTSIKNGEVEKEKINEFKYFFKNNKLSKNSFVYEKKQKIIDDFELSIKNKNMDSLNKLLKKYHNEFLIYKNNELIEKKLKRDYQIIFDDNLNEDYYSIKKTREILKNYKMDKTYKEILLIGYDIEINENYEKTLIKNKSNYHLVIYDQMISLN